MAEQLDPFLNPVQTPSGQGVTSFGSDIIQTGTNIASNSANIVVGTAGAVIAAAVGEELAPVISIAQDAQQAVDFITNPTLAGALALAGKGFPPYRNELNQFSTYNAIFTLGCLTDIELNFPLSYRALGPAIKIARSGGTGGNKIPTEYELDGKVEFFIEDVTIKTHAAPNPGTRHSNATAISFKVLEPYSMGQFYHNLRSAAIVAGHANYNEAPYLLSVEFVGYDDKEKVKNNILTRRHFPFRIISADMRVTASGAEYDVIAAPYNEMALTDNTQEIKGDIQIKGRTVAELLQTGAESLTSKLNSRGIDLENSGQIPAADYYIVSFPNTGVTEQVSSFFSTVGATMSGSNRRQELYESISGDTSGQIPVDLDARLQELPGAQQVGSALAQQLKTAAESDINTIGRQRMLPQGRGPAGSIVPQMQEAGFAPVEGQEGLFQRDQISYNSNTSTFTFKNQSSISDVIEEAIIMSDYGRSLANQTPDASGRIRWFRIETQVFNGSSAFSSLFTGRAPKVYVYRVVPYETDISNISAPSTTPFNNIIKQSKAVKGYNYIYTGQNEDIVDFQLNFNAAFFSGVQGMRGQRQRDLVLGGSNTTVSGDADAIPTTGPTGFGGLLSGLSGLVSAFTGSEPSSSIRDVGDTSTGTNGGGGREGSLEAMARMFNDQIINSGNDLINCELEIHGDPFYLADVGLGNVIGIENPLNSSITIDGQMNPLKGEVQIVLNFRTPVDYDDEDGFVKYPLGGFLPIAMFSGVYQVIEVESKFRDGKFTQVLNLGRKLNQSLLGSIASSIINYIDGGRTINEGNTSNIIERDTPGLRDD